MRHEHTTAAQILQKVRQSNTNKKAILTLRNSVFVVMVLTTFTTLQWTSNSTITSHHTLQVTNNGIETKEKSPCSERSTSHHNASTHYSLLTTHSIKLYQARTHRTDPHADVATLTFHIATIYSAVSQPPLHHYWRYIYHWALSHYFTAHTTHYPSTPTPRTTHQLLPRSLWYAWVGGWVSVEQRTPSLHHSTGWLAVCACEWLHSSLPPFPRKWWLPAPRQWWCNWSGQEESMRCKNIIEKWKARTRNVWVSEWVSEWVSCALKWSHFLLEKNA